MPNSHTRKLWYYPAIFTLAVLLDQASKYFFLKSGAATLNQDLAFSVIFRSPLAINILALLVFSLGVYYFARRYVASAAFTLVVAGGLSNILDRVFRQGVVDFIDIKIWPSFNLADCFITVGSILILYSLLTKKN